MILSSTSSQKVASQLTDKRISLSMYNAKEHALNRDNHRGLKLIEQTIKVLECVVE